MGVPGSESSILGGAAGQSSGASAFYSYQIENSLRMEAGSAMYLSRTLGTATNRDIVQLACG